MKLVFFFGLFFCFERSCSFDGSWAWKRIECFGRLIIINRRVAWCDGVERLMLGMFDSLTFFVLLVREA